MRRKVDHRLSQTIGIEGAQTRFRRGRVWQTIQQIEAHHGIVYPASRLLLDGSQRSLAIPLPQARRAAAQTLAQRLRIARLTKQLGMRLRGKGAAFVALHAGHPDAEHSREHALREPIASPQGHDLVGLRNIPSFAVGRVHLLKVAIHSCRMTDTVAAQRADGIPKLVGYGDAPDIDRFANRNHRSIDLVATGIADGSHDFRQAWGPPFGTDTTIDTRLRGTRRTPPARIPMRRKRPT